MRDQQGGYALPAAAGDCTGKKRIKQKGKEEWQKTRQNAIDEIYNKNKSQTEGEKILDILQKTGFLGSMPDVSDLSENYKEALRIKNNMPSWDPGMQKGKIVSSVYGLPIIFRP